MNVAFTVDTRPLQEAMRFYAVATKKDEADILNRAALNIAIQPYGVIANTKVAVKEEIESKLMTGGFALKLAAKKLRGQAGKRGKRGGLLKNQGWKARVGKEAKAIIGRRKAACTFAKSGWVKAAAGIGSKKQPPVRFRDANLGKGSPATPASLSATIENITKGITDVPGAALAMDRAVRATAYDMATYAAGKLGKTARRFSGKK